MNINSKICYFGAYNKTYSRNAINMRGFHELGVKIVSCYVGKPKFKSESRLSFVICVALYPITLPIRSAHSFFKGLFLYFRYSYDVILVGYQGHFDVPSAFILSGKFQLYPQDVVYVGSAGVTRWNRVISQLLPSLSVLSATASTASDVDSLSD